jgi:hypothetical protein
MEIGFGEALGITLAAETAVLFLLFRNRYAIGKIVGTSIIANLATHPLVWFVFPLAGMPYALAMIVSEFFAIGAEAVILRVLLPNIRIEGALISSALANLASFSAGILISLYIY